MEFEAFFKQYEQLVKQIDMVFEKVKSEYPDCVSCKEGCADCCHALFDLTLIEAIYINRKFLDTMSYEKQEALLESANKADRKLAKIKREAQKNLQEGKPEEAILEEMASMRVKCPLLNNENRCDMYAFRPITCRLYGIPFMIGDKAHGCGLSAFEPGKSYPTVNMDQIHKRLYEISFALAQYIKSRYPKLAEMLVPLSMALLTEYSEEYLGVKTEKEVENKDL
jgi:Fe-S-cluster containining protein